MMPLFQSHAAQYLPLRRIMGHQLKSQDELLRSFLAYLEESGQSVISVGIAVEWACLPAQTDPRWKAARLSAIRGYSAYVHAHEPELASLIPAGLIPTRVIRQQPYIYAAAQTRALMEAALTLQPVLRGQTLHTAIGLMAATGMRISECLGLNICDIDFPEDMLTVRGNMATSDWSPSAPALLRTYSSI